TNGFGHPHATSEIAEPHITILLTCNTLRRNDALACDLAVHAKMSLPDCLVLFNNSTNKLSELDCESRSDARVGLDDIDLEMNQSAAKVRCRGAIGLIRHPRVRASADDAVGRIGRRQRQLLGIRASGAVGDGELRSIVSDDSEVRISRDSRQFTTLDVGINED